LTYAWRGTGRDLAVGGIGPWSVARPPRRGSGGEARSQPLARVALFPGGDGADAARAGDPERRQAGQGRAGAAVAFRADGGKRRVRPRGERAAQGGADALGIDRGGPFEDRPAELGVARFVRGDRALGVAHRKRAGRRGLVGRDRGGGRFGDAPV